MELKLRAVSLISDEVRYDVTAFDLDMNTVSFGSCSKRDAKDYRDKWYGAYRLDHYTGIDTVDQKGIYANDIVKAEFVHPVSKDFFIGKVVFLEGRWLIENEKENMAIELWDESNVLTILEGEELEGFLNE